MSNAPVLARDRVPHDMSGAVGASHAASAGTRGTLIAVLTTVSLCGLWELSSRTVLPPEVPPISQVLVWLGRNLVGSGELWTAIALTLSHWGLGLAIALAAGTIVGVMTGVSAAVNDALLITFEFFRTIPAIVYLPLLLLLMGATSKVAVILAAIGAFWPILYQVFYGVKSIDVVARDTARVFGLTKAQRLRSITAPSILPFLATGVRISSTIALLVALAMELIGGIAGLGDVMATYSVNGVYDGMYGILLVVGCIGVLLNFGFTRLENRLLRWHPGYRVVSE